ncbi:glycosyltransferase family 2 protein [Methylopila musalis]|uniref:Glycosyltransferase family 2 protein n=1 Tax=Methylopila musalis TaxID=1134781 RepID=A0ABW3Z685_9HYPH
MTETTAPRPQADADDERRRLAQGALEAGKRGDFAAAVALWRRSEDQFGLDGEDWLAFGAALEQAGRIPEAFAAYRRLPTTPGGEFRGALEEARLHAVLHDHAAARAVLDAALQIGPNRPGEIKLRAARARGATAAGRLMDAFADFAVLSRLQPRHPLGSVGQIDVHLLNFDEAAALGAISLAHERHPGDPSVLRRRADYLMQYGDDDDLVAFIRDAADVPLPDDKYLALATALFRSRSWFFSDAFRHRLMEAAGSPAREALLGEVLKRERPSAEERLSSARKADRAIAAYPDSPRGLSTRVRLATALIETERLAEAEAVVDGLTASVRDWPSAPPLIGELLEWRAVRAGDVEAARASYWRRRRMTAYRDRTDELDSVRLLPDPPPDVVVFCQLRNERVVLPAFLRHYRGLGVTRFVMVDNGSTDGSFEHLLAQPDVELHRTFAPFRRAEAGNAWINPLIARPAYANTLCLRVDADEHLVYPQYETRPVADLWRHMQAEGADVLAGFMLDMYPETSDQLQADDFVAVSICYDRPPEPTPVVFCPYLSYRGGPRGRLLDAPDDHLTKCSGLRGGGVVEHVRASHRASPARVSSVGMALLHYKFRPDFFERASRIADERQYASASQSYAQYGRLDTPDSRSLRSEATRRFTGSAGLVADRVLRTTPAWDAASGPAPEAPRPLAVLWPQTELVRNNWGDMLNPTLVERLSGRPVRPAAKTQAEDGADEIYMVIGSHLAQASARAVVWGTGFISAQSHVREAPRRVCAVRGPLSRAMLLAQGVPCPEVYGDPAALFPLLYRPEVAVMHDVGVILHVRDRGVAALPAAPEGLRVKEIDINGGLHAVIDDILSCRAIVSSSLHGLIAAQAYGVPAVWVSFGDRVKGDGLKFRDYFASVGLDDAVAEQVTAETALDALAARARPAPRPIDLTRLIDACPFMDDGRKAELRARV